MKQMALRQKSFGYFSEACELIIAAERRDVYSYAIAFIISAKSEMLSISLFAEEVRRRCAFYKHYVPTARFCPDSLER